MTDLNKYPPAEQWHDWTELDAKAWPEKVERNYTLVPTTCFNCEAGCGLVAYHDKETGEIDRNVAGYWRENYDLMHILRRDWATLGPKLEGKLHIYVGDMDNYYLNHAVYLAEAFLEGTTDPYYGGIVDYGDRAEHCWNGDHENGNHISRLRYNTMYLPRILERIEQTAPVGADVKSWRH